MRFIVRHAFRLEQHTGRLSKDFRFGLGFNLLLDCLILLLNVGTDGH